MKLRSLALATLFLGSLAALAGSGCAVGVSPRAGYRTAAVTYVEPGYEQAYYTPGYGYAYTQPAPVYVAPSYGYYQPTRVVVAPRRTAVYAPARVQVRGPTVYVRGR